MNLYSIYSVWWLSWDDSLLVERNPLAKDYNRIGVMIRVSAFSKRHRKIKRFECLYSCRQGVENCQMKIENKIRKISFAFLVKSFLYSKLNFFECEMSKRIKLNWTLKKIVKLQLRLIETSIGLSKPHLQENWGKSINFDNFLCRAK